MKEWIAKYQKAIVGTGAVSVLLICYLQQRELTKLRAEHKMEVVVGGDIKKAQTIDSLTNMVDSLRSEAFVSEVQLGRYEVALELLKEKDRKAAELFELILTTQTEQVKNWIPKILAYILMLPILVIAIVCSLLWNVVLVGDMIFRDIKRGYTKELKSIHQNDQKRIEKTKQKEDSC